MFRDKIKLYSISEVARKLDLKNLRTNKPATHTLRFWESRFKQLKPTILSNGRRYYSEKNIQIIKLIVFLLKDQGLTINGAIKIMNDKSKELDAGKELSIKDTYNKKIIIFKSRKILEKIKKLNGKKNTR